MKLKYLLPLVILAACAKPEAVVPVIEQDYTFEIWQCMDEQDFKLCYMVQLESAGYKLEVEGKDYKFEIPSSDTGCRLSKASVLPGELWVTLRAPGVSETKYLMIE